MSPNSFNAKRLRSKTMSRLSRASPYPHWIVFVRLSATERYPVKPAPSRQFTSSLSCHGAAAGKIAMGNPSSRPSPEREKVWPSAISRCARAHSATSARRFRCHSGRFTRYRRNRPPRAVFASNGTSQTLIGKTKKVRRDPFSKGRRSG